MPEYLAPGVFVEEVSFRSKSIEGVPTSTTGFAGMTRFGPVRYKEGPKTTQPRLMTSFTEFEQVYGGLEELDHEGLTHPCYLAHAARAFFMNGGKRLYISRVFSPTEAQADSDNPGVAQSDPIPVGDITAHWRARWPGRYGNVVVETRLVRSKNIRFDDAKHGPQARGVRDGAVVEIVPGGANAELPDGNDAPDPSRLAVVEIEESGKQLFVRSDGNPEGPEDGEIVQLVQMQVLVRVNSERVDAYTDVCPSWKQKRSLQHILQPEDPEDENAVVYFDWDETKSNAKRFLPAQLLVSLRGSGEDSIQFRLSGGNDGALVTADDIAGDEADPDDPKKPATGLEALAEVDEIAIVAAPDGGGFEDKATVEQVADRLITHAEQMRYRIAVIDAPKGSSINEIRAFRGKFDSKYAALYHPWIEIFDPTERPSQGAPPKRLLLPPSGFVTGIYARTDIERGVHKAPANEIVRGLTRFEANINKPRQEVLNPVGINALRFFENRGNRVWGARTLSSDPEWKYVNVRRLFIYIEHSIDIGTQWAVFEPNNSRLWANIRQTVEDFLLVLWRDGALLGDKPEDAYFVRCDRTTMTQNDLDNGRLICLIGVAPTKPAEFVIFRIGQWTGDAKH